MGNKYTFVSANGGRYVERDSMGAIKHEVKQYSPSSTHYRAVAIDIRRWVILTFSPYTIGPNIAGYLSEST